MTEKEPTENQDKEEQPGKPEPPEEPPLPPTQKDVVLYHGEFYQSEEEKKMNEDQKPESTPEQNLEPESALPSPPPVQTSADQTQGQASQDSQTPQAPLDAPPSRGYVAIMLIVAGIFSIVTALGITALTCLSIPTILIFGPLGGYYLYSGIKMMKDDRFVMKSWIPIVMVCHLITCDLVVAGLGITCIIMATGQEYKDYNARFES